MSGFGTPWLFASWTGRHKKEKWEQNPWEEKRLGPYGQEKRGVGKMKMAGK